MIDLFELSDLLSLSDLEYELESVRNQLKELERNGVKDIAITRPLHKELVKAIARLAIVRSSQPAIGQQGKIGSGLMGN